MRLFRSLAISLLFFGFATVAVGEVKLPSIIGSNMVLQRGEKVPVWGWSEPGTEVHVLFDKKALKATADKNGRWQVMLGPLTVGKPKTMVIETNRGDRVQLDNILVGEVWIGSGQSNMEFPMTKVTSSKKEIAAANYPNLRLFNVKKAATTEPQKDCIGAWAECTPQSVSHFSAVAYFFGQKLMNDLDIPVGIIASSWGGTRVEAWTPLEDLEAKEPAKPLLKWWEAAVQKDTKLATNPHRPTNLYNAMINPLVPYGIRGAIWYQGESNRNRAVQYETLFPTMIGAWRRVWNKPEMPFGFVQLAPFRYKTKRKMAPEGTDLMLCELWEAQTKTLKNRPNIGMAVTTDITTLNDIHPPNKKPVGDRLALWALATVYGKDLVYSGPIYKSMKVEGDKIRLSFDHLGGGLKSSNGKPLDFFTIAGADEKFYPATATIDNKTIVVSTPKVKKPIAVRLGWHEAATPNLINKEGLPASPFRTDRFKSFTEGRLTPWTEKKLPPPTKNKKPQKAKK